MKPVTEDILRKQAIEALMKVNRQLSHAATVEHNSEARAEVIANFLAVKQLLSIPWRLPEAEAERQETIKKVEFALALLGAPTIEQWEAARERAGLV